MTPKHRSLTREGLIACGQNPGKASPKNPWTKTGVVAGNVQEYIAQKDPVAAAEMRLEADPDGLTLDAQCVIDGTLHPDQAGEEVLQNLFEYNSKFARSRIAFEKAEFDERIASGNATLEDRLRLEENGDPRVEALKAKQDAANARAKRDQETINAAMAMQSKEAARQELLAMNGGVG